MSLRKRGGIWWIDFIAPNGQRVRRSAETGNKTQAQELHDKLKAEVWRVSKLGDRPRRIWQDAVVRWLKEQAHKASLEDDKSKLRWLDRHLADMELETITRATIDRITEAKRAEGASNGTVNRVLALVRAILRRCAGEWEWLDKAPTIRLLKEPRRRIRFLTQEQAQALMRELPEHLADMASFSLCTGLRAANVTGLTWEQVDLERKHAWVHPDQSKSRQAIAVPLNATAMQIVQQQMGKHPERVFTYAGNPIHQVSTRAWYQALKRAGIDDFRWHDLRHTWASWHVQGGTPLFVLQELGGWETASMVRRYAHLAANHLAPWADQLAIARVNGTNPSQGSETQGSQPDRGC